MEITRTLSIIIICLELSVKIVQVTAQYRRQDLHEPIFDLVDLERYFKNDRLVNFQTKCLFYKKPCDILGKWIKARLSDGLLGLCHQCTAIQAENLQKVITHLKRHRPDVYNKALLLYLDKERLATVASRNYWYRSNQQYDSNLDLFGILTTPKSSGSFSVPILPSRRRKKPLARWRKIYF